MDMTFSAGLGTFNFRVGAMIRRGDQILMACNPQARKRCYYSVGGRVRYGETMEEAVLREVREETGMECEVERLVCIHENFFTSDDGTPFHEISCYFTIKDTQAFTDITDGFPTTGGPEGEYLIWVDRKKPLPFPIYPAFFRELDFGAGGEVRHIVTKE